MRNVIVGFILGVSVALGTGAFAGSDFFSRLDQKQQLALQQNQMFEMMRQQQQLQDMQQQMQRGYPCR